MGRVKVPDPPDAAVNVTTGLQLVVTVAVQGGITMVPDGHWMAPLTVGNTPVVGVGVNTVDVMGTKLSVTETVPVGIPLPAATMEPSVIE